jgi:eukaryotic-like serine/threonine-protein kinase
VSRKHNVRTDGDETRLSSGPPPGDADAALAFPHLVTNAPADDADLTRLPSEANPTRLGTDADATQLGLGADATQLGLDAAATQLGLDADATQLGTPAASPGTPDDLTVLGPAGGNAPAFEPATPSRPPTGRRDTSRGLLAALERLQQRQTDAPVAAAGTPTEPTDQKSLTGPIETGEAFGTRYHIISVLGVGGMGAVYKAWDAELGEAVALKVVRPEIAADPVAASEIERRFKRELLLARQVTHPNVVRIHDLGEVKGIKYITMPYIEGSDLATILKEETKLPVERALRIARGTVSGLVAAHGAGVIHRDLKPANIMIGPNDEPTLMDFGIARSAGGPELNPKAVSPSILHPDISRTAALAASSTVAGAIVGTVAYMAPEQAKGQPVDERADIYAFGLILYDMLVGGRRSPRALSAVEEMQHRMVAPPPPPRSIEPGIPEAVDAIVRRCLEPDAAKRFQKTVDLEAALARLDEHGKPLPIMRRVSRRTMLAVAVLFVLILAGTFYTTKWLSAPVRQPDPVSVVIADVRNTTGDATFDNTIAPTLRRALEDASFISAVDRTKLPNVGVVKVPAKLDEVAAREIAVKQGLGVVLAGSIAPYRSGYEISVKATQTVTGKEIVSASARASSKDKVLETAAKLMARVRKVLGDRTSQSDQLFAMRSVSASSLEVVNLYAAGMEAQSRGKFEDARKNLARAVELDPNFGLGYQGLSAMSSTLGRTDEAKKEIQEALRHVDGMTARESFFTRGAYYRLNLDYRNCAKEYGELLSRYPADSVARAQRAACLLFMRNIPEALKEMQQAVKMLPNHVAFRINLALIAYRAGQFQLVEDEVNAMEQPDPRVLLALAYSQMGRGMVNEANETYKRVAAADPKNAWAQSGLADVLVYQGRFSEAIPMFEQTAAADVAEKNTKRAALKFLSAANAYVQRGQHAPAASMADKALQQSNITIVKFLAAQIFVETGAIEKAQGLATELSKSTESWDDARVYGKIIEAQIALKKKDARQAIRLLTDANNMLDTWVGHFNLGRAYLEAGEFVLADSEFDLCITRRGEVLTVVDEGPTYGMFPIVYYYRGRVREEMKTASFADSYREYLKIRGASTEDPLVPDARKRAGN